MNIYKKNVRSFIDISLCNLNDLYKILKYAVHIKEHPELYRGKLSDKNIALLFFEPSTRTRISFEVGINALGGNSILLNNRDMQLHRGESIKDTALILSQYVDLIVLRCLDHNVLLELDAYSNVPVINGLTKSSHPCQVIAAIMTYEEKYGKVSDSVVSWIGDNNNMLASWIHAAVIMKFKLNISTPQECYPKNLIEWARSLNHEIFWSDDPTLIIPEADIITTDSWESMGSDIQANRDEAIMKFKKYQINTSLLTHAKKNHMFLHCLPAYINQEVTKEVIESPNSYIFNEAENKMYVQNAIILWCLGLI